MTKKKKKPENNNFISRNFLASWQPMRDRVVVQLSILVCVNVFQAIKGIFDQVSCR